MNKRYIGIWRESDRLRVEITEDPASLLTLPHGRAGALIPARLGGAAACLPSTCTIVFLLAKKPGQLLAALADDLSKDEDVLEHTFLTHGHAQVVLLLARPEEWTKIQSVVGEFLAGYEVWSIYDGVVDEMNIETLEPTPEQMPTVVKIDPDKLEFESAVQIRQFNSNLAVLARVVWAYAPEIWPLVERLGQLVADIASSLTTEPSKHNEAGSIRSRIRSETVLIETNAVLSLYCSQLSSGTLPLHKSNFPVGEYSLLGIGGMSRAAWRLYDHLNLIFAKFDHASIIRELYPRIAAFNPFGASSSVRDLSTWQPAKYSFERLTDKPNPAPRYHVPYFSSRWGFHESLHSISLSWQCLYASASKEWNLLTLTHEFIHSQVRAIFGEILRTESAGSSSDVPVPDSDS